MVEYKISSFCRIGDCVEVGQLPGGSVAVRDSKNPDDRSLVFSHAEWEAFVQGVKAGEFDVRP